MGTLYLVATPIGNLEDISLRALRLLKEVTLIAAEDTRHTIKLLNHFGITTRQVSYHEHNKLKRLDVILAALAEGDVALVSDAGTPAINDPGYELVRAVLEAGFPVSPIPGASSPIAALVASGLPTESFTYLGYLPRRSGERRQFLEKRRELDTTLIFLETPHRLMDALSDLHAVLGDREACVAGEITKLYEEFVRMPLSGLLDHFAGYHPRGEFVIVVAGADLPQVQMDEKQLREAIQSGLEAGKPARELAAELAETSGLSRNNLYRQIVATRRQTDKIEPSD